MLALQQVDIAAGERSAVGHDRLADQRTMAGQVQELVQRGLVLAVDSGGAVTYVLSESGRTRLRMLTIDLARELEMLQEATRALVRVNLVPLSLSGARSVALYPFGETAEMAYAVVTGLGFDVVGIVDDSPRKWGIRFHGLQVQPASALLTLAPDAVLVTSAVFQREIVAKLNAMPLAGTRIHVL
ncbi:MAG: hypothetical protein LH616_12755 [Ilumatobacteraceae bacterium]|nr:hypothetical protein [Ilumatobacteraceae bacterium]